MEKEIYCSKSKGGFWKMKQELTDEILKEINYTPTAYGGKYDDISVPEIVELAIKRTREYDISKSSGNSRE